MKETYTLRSEAILFLFFGMFHIHRIWAFIDPEAYSKFWLGLVSTQGKEYYALGIILVGMSISLIILFVLNIKRLFWWRWFYLIGGLYVLIDVCLNLLEVDFMQRAIVWLFTVEGVLWYIIWGNFVLLGLLSLFLSQWLWKKSKTIGIKI